MSIVARVVSRHKNRIAIGEDLDYDLPEESSYEQAIQSDIAFWEKNVEASFDRYIKSYIKPFVENDALPSAQREAMRDVFYRGGTIDQMHDALNMHPRTEGCWGDPLSSWWSESQEQATKALRLLNARKDGSDRLAVGFFENLASRFAYMAKNTAAYAFGKAYQELLDSNEAWRKTWVEACDKIAKKAEELKYKQQYAWGYSEPINVFKASMVEIRSLIKSDFAPIVSTLYHARCSTDTFVSKTYEGYRNYAKGAQKSAKKFLTESKLIKLADLRIAQMVRYKKECEAKADELRYKAGREDEARKIGYFVMTISQIVSKIETLKNNYVFAVEHWNGWARDSPKTAARPFGAELERIESEWLKLPRPEQS